MGRLLIEMSLIALGVTGGIGAYKAVEVCRGLQKRGHDVVAVMTRSAARFVGPVTFEAITRRPVITSQWRPGMNADIEHIAIADGIHLLLVAPCTANVIGKFANGIADDFLSSLYLATRAPVMLAPAMNSNMLAHEAVQRNLRTLAARGVRFVEPGEGYLACGWIGKGRLAEPEAVVDAACAVLSPPDSLLRGRHVLVSAGPTYEDLDPVRYLGNRSSGRMGFALAAHARQRGARVTLVAGPTRLEPPAVDEVVRVRSAAEMHEAIMAAASSADVVIMAAAVADFTPGIDVRGESRKDRWAADADAQSHQGHPRRSRRPAICQGGRRTGAGGVRGGNRRPVAQGAREARAQERRPDRGQRRVAAGPRLRRRYQRGDARQRRGRRTGLAAEQGTGGGRHPRSRGAPDAYPRVSADAPLSP